MTARYLAGSFNTSCTAEAGRLNRSRTSFKPYILVAANLIIYSIFQIHSFMKYSDNFNYIFAFFILIEDQMRFNL
jgi:hypothetical protein